MMYFRACAAFYKRSKISGKRLTCRQGDNQCVFRKRKFLFFRFLLRILDVMNSNWNKIYLVFCMTREKIAISESDYNCFRCIADEKFMCRSCRFDKCTELGMEYSPVMNENEKEDSSEDVNEASPSSNEEKPLIELIRTAYEWVPHFNFLNHIQCLRNSYPKRLEHEIYVSKKHNLKRLYHPTEVNLNLFKLGSFMILGVLY